jgi:hypothetical protein
MLVETPLAISLGVAAAVFVSGIAGFNLHRVLPEHHLSKETHDVIRLGAGMLSVLASLVLGLMIATVKTSYDSTNAALHSYAADLTVLDETLRDYGDAALPARRLLRDYTLRLLDNVWRDPYHHPFLVEDRAAGQILEHARDQIRALPVATRDQQWIVDQALQIATSLLRERWLLLERSGPSVHPLVIVMLMLWIAAIFVSFGINAPQHATMYAVFLVLSVAIGSAMFLVLEMDAPFAGLMQISGVPIETALAHMLPAGT